MAADTLTNAATQAADAAEPARHMTREEFARQLQDFSLNDLLQDLSRRLVNLVIDIAVAIIVFYVGKFIIKRIYRLIASILVRRKVDNSLTTFILSFVKIVLYFILIVTVIGILGIETSSFLAIFASAGVAIGMALSGTLQNFAGGVLLLLLKPYKVGDYVETQGYAGTVREIQIFHTIITTPDNKAIIIPNGVLSTSSINNWSRESYRRVSWDVAISYGDGVEAARKAILDLFAGDSRIVNQAVEATEISAHNVNDECGEGDPCDEKRPSLFARIFRRHSDKVKNAIDKWEESRQARLDLLKPHVTKDPAVVVKELADSSVNLSVRAWVHTADYWNVFYEYNERIYTELPKCGVQFPFPQMDVHVKNS